LEKEESDIHGKRRLPVSIISSFGSQFVVIVSGFVLPRLIDTQLGQESLGTWDFAWSLISHFSLLQVGVVSSVNRYVARFRSAADPVGLNRSVSSVAAVLFAIAILILLLTIACVMSMPSLLETTLQSHITEARYVTAVLGASLAVQVGTSIYGGVLTGCHRWDYHNAVHTVLYTLMLGGMIVVLYLGFGIIGLALVNLVGETLGPIIRARACSRVCPELSVRFRNFDGKTAREMMHFGGKMFTSDCAYLLLNQTASLIVITKYGPAALALFARPMALIRTIKVFITKYGNVLVPTASSYDTRGEASELRQLALSATAWGAFLTLPAAAFLLISGGDLLAIWMGPRYADSTLMAALVGVYFFSNAYAPLFYILAGLNRHGRIAGAMLGAALLGILLAGIAVFWFDAGIISMVFALGFPWALVTGIYLPLKSSATLDVSLFELVRKAWLKPIMCTLPLVIALLAVHFLIPADANPRKRFAVSCGFGGLMLVLSYWHFVSPEGWKRRILRRTLSTGAA
jgi:O-antigen/teichoic acid export membrane protein